MNKITTTIFATTLFLLPMGAGAKEITSANVLALMNKDRAANHVRPLKEMMELDRSASAKDADMVTNRYFAHTSPAGKSLVWFINSAKYRYRTAGENLATGFQNAEDEEKAFMSSPTHRANILDPEYHDVGISVGGGYVVIHFGRHL
jgi:uncharacterized protein YkwD